MCENDPFEAFISGNWSVERNLAIMAEAARRLGLGGDTDERD